MDLRRCCTRHQPDSPGHGLGLGRGGVLDLQALSPHRVFQTAQAPSQALFPSLPPSLPPPRSSSLHSERMFRMLALETFGEQEGVSRLSDTQLPVNRPAVQGLAAPPV